MVNISKPPKLFKILPGKELFTVAMVDSNEPSVVLLRAGWRFDTMINSERFEREKEIESFYYSLLMNNEIYNGFYTVAIHLEFVTEYSQFAKQKS